MQKKGVYPYDYMDSFQRFGDQQIPPKDDEGISEAQYEHAQKVWNIFSCKNMGDYHDLYFESDILLLTDERHAFNTIS